MPHSEHRLPSVTQIIGATHEKKFLVEAAAKLGTNKATALWAGVRQYLKGSLLDDDEAIVRCIPESWFKYCRIARSDFWKTHTEVWGEKADVGKRFHDITEKYFQGIACEVPSDLVQMWENFKVWVIQNKVQALALERQVVSETFGYQGTYDALIMMGESGPIIADWKTSSAIDRGEYVLQLGAYAQAETETTGRDIVGGIVVRVDKITAKIETMEFSRAELKEAFVVFLAAKQVFDWHQKHGVKWKRR